MDIAKLQPWINAGYALFAKEGPKGLKVEVLAKRVGKSKSSFYHHFADLEVFTEFLLHYHGEQLEILGQKEAQAKSIDPELLDVLVEAKTDLLFNRQLRVHRNVPAFEKVLKKETTIIEDAFLLLWAKEMGLPENVSLIRQFFAHSLENFYLILTEENITQEWLRQYLQGIQNMVHELRKTLEPNHPLFGHS